MPNLIFTISEVGITYLLVAGYAVDYDIIFKETMKRKI
jgi:hypothetical protein